MIVVDALVDIDKVLSEITKLDNTSNDDFQLIQVVSSKLETKETGVSVYRYMVDLNLTPKGNN